ncbi:MAG: SUMF1/EgtB/PvdO family nonheme iron enzyme [Acidobacteriota bacterium]|nr:SUMF1/EgtB/PvdO family nonheme iron enzyme [Acidobacteriota bacterium]
MHYEDFIIRIGAAGPKGYAVQVVDSPAGQGEGVFQPPFDPRELNNLMGELGRRGQLPSTAGQGTVPWFRNIQSKKEEEWTRLSLQRFGELLYTALFQGEIKSRYEESLGRVEGKGRGLRLVIKQDPRHPDLARIFSLPWEYLYRPDPPDFLSLSRKSPVVRYPAVPRPEGGNPLPERLRILALVAAPTDLSELDLEAEREHVRAAWCTHPSVKIDYFEHADLPGLRKRLLTCDYHVLHFMGHGGFDQIRAQGLLYFENGDGLGDPVSGERLATFLKDFRTIRLVFLNACQTGQNDTSGVNAFAGVAAALVMGGLPAVLAMQYPVSDRAAIAFGETFYRRLAAGDPVDTAVVEGRLAIHALDERGTEWGTPVLYSRVPGGLLFAPRAPECTPKSTTLSIPGDLLHKKPKRPWLKPTMAAATVLGATLGFQYTDFSFSSTDQPERSKPFMEPEKNKPAIEPGPSYPAGMEKTLTLPGGVPLTLVWVPAGRFTMGSSALKVDEKPFTAVLTRGFWIGKTEITQKQWVAVMGKNPSHFKGDDARPVDTVNYRDVISFLVKLQQKLNLPGLNIPTEAQWEYACRGGSEEFFPGNPQEVGWFGEGETGGTHPVAGKKPNAYGLFDMHGNVWEWVRDWYADYPAGEMMTDPKGPKKGAYKVLRGGSYVNPEEKCSCTNRFASGISGEEKHVGFRLVLEE